VLVERLRAGLTDLGIDAGPAAQTMLLDYLQLLERWNRRYNLTAVREPGAMVTRHLLDSLALLPHVGNGTLIDVGSGAGLPGIPLAIADPHRPVTVLDSNGKKTRFLEHVRATLKLANVAVVKARVEDYRPQAGFDRVVSRAFASLDDMIRSCRHLLGPRGEFLAMKGQVPDRELAAAQTLARLVSMEALAVPGLDEARCLVRLAPLEGSGSLDP
jgi:16S rRNA (guanine527-N7)-methyltransferase